MITIDLSILNQKGTPMFYSDLFADRPPFGIEGRIFISTDTKEFYRDTGSSWELLAGPGGGTITGSGTANELSYFTGSSTIASLSTAVYPNLTELSYVKGVTSGIQTQLNGKQGSITLTTTGTSGAATLIGNTLNIPQYQSVITNPITGTGTATQVAFFNSSSSITGNNDLYWDNANSRLGIGNNTPAVNLDIHGSNATIQIDGRSSSNSYVQFVKQGVSKWRIGNIAASDYFQLYDNTNALERLKVENTGLFTLTGNLTNVLTKTAVSNDGWYGIFSNETITIPASTSFSGGNSFSSLNGKNGMSFAGNATFDITAVPSGVLSTNVLSFTNAGSTITITQAGGTRAMSAITAFNQLNSVNSGTITHIAGFHVIAPYRAVGGTDLTCTNYYGLLINASNERTAFTITNAWGIYQEGSSDKNYFNGTTLIGTSTDNLSGAKLQVSGAATITGNVGIGVSGAPSYKLTLEGASTTYGTSPSIAFYVSVVTANARNWLIGNVATEYGNLVFASSTAQGGAPTTARMTLNKDGNLGLGVTPSAWDATNTKALQLDGGSLYMYGGDRVFLGQNIFFGSLGDTYVKTAPATTYRQYNGIHSWYTAPSGTAGNAITFTQAMTLDASANLSIANEMYLDNGKYLRFKRSSGGLSIQTLGIVSGTDDVRLLTTGAFDVANGSLSSMLRITSGGNVGIGTTNPQMPLSVQANTGNAAIRLIGTSNASSNNAGIYWYDSNDSTFNAYLGNFSASFDIYNQRSTPISFYTTATERMRITSAGRLLVGTTTDNLTDILQVKGSIYSNATNTNLYLDNGGSGGATLKIGVTGSTSTYINSIDAHPIIISTSNTERMRINATGGIEMKTNLTLTSFTTSATASSINKYVQINVDGTNYLVALYSLP